MFKPEVVDDEDPAEGTEKSTDKTEEVIISIKPLVSIKVGFLEGKNVNCIKFMMSCECKQKDIGWHQKLKSLLIHLSDPFQNIIFLVCCSLQSILSSSLPLSNSQKNSVLVIQALPGFI